MKLTASDLKPFKTPDSDKPIRQPPKYNRPTYDWDELNKLYEGKTVRFIHEQTGIPKSAIYKAHYAKKIKTDAGPKWRHDWEFISELGKTRTIKQLSSVTGLSQEQLRTAVKRKQLTHYLPVYTRKFK